MIFWTVWLLFMIICLGRYNIAGYKLLPQKFAFPYVEFLIIFLTCFRFNVGYDWSSYYNVIWPSLDDWEVNRFEFIPRQFCIFANYIRCPGIVFALHQIPTLLLFFYGFKYYSKSRYESLLLFFCLFFPDSLSTIRQWLAMAILFYAFKFVKQRKLFNYLLLSVIAFFCHKSSCLAALLIYMIYNFIPFKLVIFSGLGVLVFGKKIIEILIGLDIPFSFYLRAIENFSDAGGNKLKFFLLLLCFFCLFFYCLKKIKTVHLQKLLAISLVGVVCSFVLGGHLGMRLGVYFYFVLLVPEIMDIIKNIKFRAVFMSFMYLYLFLSLHINVKSHDPTFIPYRLYFFVNPEYETIK